MAYKTTPGVAGHVTLPEIPLSEGVVPITTDEMYFELKSNPADSTAFVKPLPMPEILADVPAPVFTEDGFGPTTKLEEPALTADVFEPLVEVKPAEETHESAELSKVFEEISQTTEPLIEKPKATKQRTARAAKKVEGN